MTVAEAAATRDITEILHYTTSRGLIGVLASKSLKSRARLPEDKYLEHIWVPSCRVRYDDDWLDFVNLSISDINSALYTIASGKWHAGEFWWGVLSFSPEILNHEGVCFATTNNIYPSVRRGTGVEGFEALFALEVEGRYGRRIVRGPRHLLCQPTDPQAEVLYPGELSTMYLQTIYVPDQTSRAQVLATCEAVGHHEMEVRVDQDVFS